MDGWREESIHTCGLTAGSNHVIPDVQGLLPCTTVCSCTHGGCEGMHGGRQPGSSWRVAHAIVHGQCARCVTFAGAHLQQGCAHPAVWLTACRDCMVPDLRKQAHQSPAWGDYLVLSTLALICNTGKPHFHLHGAAGQTVQVQLRLASWNVAGHSQSENTKPYLQRPVNEVPSKRSTHGSCVCEDCRLQSCAALCHL